MSSQPLARRNVLRGAALVGVACVGTAACSTGSGNEADATPDSTVELGAASAVPVGGAKIYHEQALVVSQPSRGTFKCFSAKCTHQGAILADVDKEQGHCALHGSRFDLTTGKVVQGPASRPLPEVPVKAEGGKLIAG